MKRILTDTNTYLLKYRENIFSQFGEDGILSYIFRVIPEKNRWSVEFCAWDGIFASNICNFVKNQGWYGVYIEADKNRFRDLLKNHGNNDRVFCLNRFIDFKGPDKLDHILNTIKELPKDFDLLSIDIDSCDYYVWQSLTKYHPKVVIIEFNPTIPVDYEYVQNKSFNIHDEHSLSSVTNLAKKKGYELISCTDSNAIFIVKKYYPLFHIKNNSPKTLYKPFEKYYQTKIWQGGDGTLHLIGCQRLLWHNILINENKIQVLPKYLRFFPGKTHPLLQLFKKFYYQFPIISKVMNLIIAGKYQQAENEVK